MMAALVSFSKPFLLSPFSSFGGDLVEGRLKIESHRRFDQARTC
jgi:hypothetical protein